MTINFDHNKQVNYFLKYMIRRSPLIIKLFKRQPNYNFFLVLLPGSMSYFLSCLRIAGK